VLVVQYEELVIDLPAQVQRIATFLALGVYQKNNKKKHVHKKKVHSKCTGALTFESSWAFYIVNALGH
jgi:hypothetical protein